MYTAISSFLSLLQRTHSVAHVIVMRLLKPRGAQRQPAAISGADSMLWRKSCPFLSGVRLPQKLCCYLGFPLSQQRVPGGHLWRP